MLPTEGLKQYRGQGPVTPRLPETAGKLEVISMAPGNTIDTIYLGNNATEARIKKSLP